MARIDEDEGGGTRIDVLLMTEDDEGRMTRDGQDDDER
jgi:hypothetical protein